MSTIDTLPHAASNAHPLDLTSKQIGVAVLRLVGRAFANVARAIYLWQQRSSQKRALYDLDSRMLNDLGLSQSDIQNAFGPPIWHRLGR